MKEKQQYKFVTADWLQQRLEKPDLRIIQVNGEQYYQQIHIPGAVLIRSNSLVIQRNGVPGIRAETSSLVRQFRALGITARTEVIAYDSAGGTDASRLIWTLATLGHNRGAVLDGGIETWLQEKRPLSREEPQIQPTVFEPHPDNSWEADLDHVSQIASGAFKESLLLDVRTPQEYAGRQWRGPRGHIAGALHMNWTETLVDRSNPLLKPRHQLLEMLAARGVIDKTREVTVYCQTGHRAAQTWVLLQHLGFQKTRLYDGSIAEWGWARQYPLVTGDVTVDQCQK